MEKISENLKKCIDFHGHFCPGLAYGYVIAEEALKLLDINRSQDEEVVVISENDSCTVDAFQVILGATLGKGNLIIRNYGKSVYTVYSRKDKRAFKFVKKDEYEYKGKEKEEFKILESKLQGKVANNAEKKRQKYLKGCDIVQRNCNEIFNICFVEIPEPSLAELDNSIKCEICGEYTMRSRTLDIKGRKCCIPCSKIEINKL